MQCGYGHYKPLMARFDTVVDAFLALAPAFQRVIADITQRMGAGMAEFIQRDVRALCVCFEQAGVCARACLL
jgi:farnesyl-diphosphate farnesyltransferase